MPHQCVRCGQLYGNGAKEILSGCNCGCRVFFFVKKEKLDNAKALIDKDLDKNQKSQVEKDVLNMVDLNKDDLPVVLDFETVRVLEPGKYQLDLVKLFNGESLVFRLEEGKYVVDISETFKRFNKK